MNESRLARRLAANTLHAAGGRVASILLWLFFTPAILRELGAAGFGVWSLFYALTGYLSTLDFGLVQAVVRHVAAARGRGAHREAGAFATLGVMGCLALGLAWFALIAVLHRPVLRWLQVPAELVHTATFAMFAGAAVFAAAGIANVAIAVAQGYGRFDLANRMLLAAMAGQAVGFVVVLQRHLGLEGLVVSVGLGWLIGCGVGVAVLRAALQEFHWTSPRESLGLLGPVVRFGGPMQVTNLLSVINLHLDKVLLSNFVSLAAVAPYELGSRVAGAASTLPQLLLLAVMPEAAAIHEVGNTQRLRELYDRGSRYTLTAGALVLAPVLACADRLYEVWIGPGHTDAALSLRALSVAAGFSLATGMGTTIARAIARTDLEAWFALCAVSIHLVLSLILLPRVGLPGALVASQIAHAVGAALFLVLLGRALAWPLVGVVLKPCGVPLLATIVGAGTGTLLDRLIPAVPGALAWLQLVSVAAGATLATLGVVVVTRYFRWDEARRLLMRAVRR